MTRRLYYEDVDCLEFSARVRDCQESQAGFLVWLDATAFYPEGGGQPADHGLLDGIPVLDVQEQAGDVVHLCAAALQPGVVVQGQVDAVRRRDLVEQHSGEHILSGLICSQFSCNNVGFHIGSDVVTIDFDTECTLEQLLPLEAAANRLIRDNVETEIFIPTPEVLEKLQYRSKKTLEGPVRLVRFPGADLCACCGLHIKRSGELGMVKILRCDRSRGGVRIELVCGGRAISYVTAVWRENIQNSRALSAKPLETAEAVRRTLEELSEKKQRVADLEAAWCAARAAQYRGRGDVLLVEAPMTAESLRSLASAVAETSGGRCAAFAGEKGQYQYAVISTAEALGELANRINTALHGRGGGRGGCIQGKVMATETEIRTFFAQENRD